jgi:hypothetical protein
MVSVTVFVKKPGGKEWEPLGGHEFEVLPRLGEHVGAISDDDMHLYRVVSLHHSLNPIRYPCELFAVQDEEWTDFHKKLFAESK